MVLSIIRNMRSKVKGIQIHGFFTNPNRDGDIFSLGGVKAMKTLKLSGHLPISD